MIEWHPAYFVIKIGSQCPGKKIFVVTRIEDHRDANGTLIDSRGVELACFSTFTLAKIFARRTNNGLAIKLGDVFA